MKNSVPNTFTAEDPATKSDRVCRSGSAPSMRLATVQATFQLARRRNSSRACTSARLRRTHGSSITLAPSARRAVRAQAMQSSRWRDTMPDEHSVTRSRLSWLMISPQPRFSSPTIESAGTRQSSKKVWLMSWADSRSRGSVETPGVSMGMQNSEMPLCLGTSGSVRAASQM